MAEVTDADLAEAQRILTDPRSYRVGLRRAIAGALAACRVSARVDQREKVLALAAQLESDAATGEYRGGGYAADVLTDVAGRIRKVVA